MHMGVLKTFKIKRAFNSVDYYNELNNVNYYNELNSVEYYNLENTSQLSH